MINDIQINSSGGVFWKEIETETSDGGEIIITKCHRSSVLPSSSIDDLPEEVKNFCKEKWTAQVVQAWKNEVEA